MSINYGFFIYMVEVKDSVFALFCTYIHCIIEINRYLLGCSKNDMTDKSVSDSLTIILTPFCPTLLLQ